MAAANIRHGPHRPPYIDCGSCGTSHHYDAANGEYQGRCRNCGDFLRRPTDEEHEQFTEFLAWNSAHYDRDRREGEPGDGGA